MLTDSGKAEYLAQQPSVGLSSRKDTPKASATDYGLEKDKEERAACEPIRLRSEIVFPPIQELV